MNVNVMLKKLAKRFPKRFAKMNHDHVGLMTGKKPEEVHKILCLTGACSSAAIIAFYPYAVFGGVCKRSTTLCIGIIRNIVIRI